MKVVLIIRYLTHSSEFYSAEMCCEVMGEIWLNEEQMKLLLRMALSTEYQILSQSSSSMWMKVSGVLWDYAQDILGLSTRSYEDVPF